MRGLEVLTLFLQTIHSCPHCVDKKAQRTEGLDSRTSAQVQSSEARALQTFLRVSSILHLNDRGRL